MEKPSNSKFGTLLAKNALGQPVIFILALTAIAAPVFTAAGDAIACAAANTNNCNVCQKDNAGAATAFCYDCKPGYRLSVAGVGTSVCTRCPTGTGKAGGTATAASVVADLPTTVQAENTCTACNAGCAECWLPSSATSCARCPVGTFATGYAAGAAGGAAAATAPTGTCTSMCNTGRTRDVATTDITADETETAACVACTAGCAECKGTGAGKCTKCAAGYFLSAKAAATDLMGTCSWCTGGMGKDADASVIAATTAATTSAVACTTKCTGTDCGACSTAKPAECLACASDFTFDATAKTCKKTATPAGSSATLIQALCGASVAAYALF